MIESRRWIGMLVGAWLVSAAALATDSGFQIGLRGGLFDPTGSPDTFDAVYGGDRMTQLGVDFKYRSHGSLLVQLAVDHGTLDGETVVVLPGGGTVGTGVETELTLTPVHLSVAWSFGGPGARFHVGVGPTYLDWQDENDFEDTSGSGVGYHVVLGLERLGRRTVVGGELRYSTIPDAIGEGGASAFFGEDDLGGLSAHLVVGWRF